MVVEWGVYEQRVSGVTRVGTVNANGAQEALGAAREKYFLRWPMVHELNARGREIYPENDR